MVFTSKIILFWPHITRKSPEFTIFLFRFVNVSSMGHIWWTQLGPEEKKFGLHHFRPGNEKVWSDSMIRECAHECWRVYKRLFFDHILPLRFWIWYCELRSGDWLRDSLGKSLIYMVLWPLIPRVWLSGPGEMCNLYAKRIVTVTRGGGRIFWK